MHKRDDVTVCCVVLCCVVCRLAKMMMRQFSGCNLEHQPDRFDYFANRFSSLPIYFLRFHGSTDVDQVSQRATRSPNLMPPGMNPIDQVLDAMDYAVYVLDVKHIVLDNLQFMLSGQAKGNEGWDLQNTAIEKFRRFATTKNVHISLVVHPRKEVGHPSMCVCVCVCVCERGLGTLVAFDCNHCDAGRRDAAGHSECVWVRQVHAGGRQRVHPPKAQQQRALRRRQKEPIRRSAQRSHRPNSPA